jgi:hypothetical protein
MKPASYFYIEYRFLARLSKISAFSAIVLVFSTAALGFAL